MKKLTVKQREKIKGLIANQVQCDEDEITPHAHVINDLGGDSLDWVELVMCLEEAFEIQITDAEAEKAFNLESIEKLVEKKLNGSAESTSNESVA